MKGIILKANCRVEKKAYEDLCCSLANSWDVDHVMILPTFLDLVAIVDDDDDSKICVVADKLISVENENNNIE